MTHDLVPAGPALPLLGRWARELDAEFAGPAIPPQDIEGLAAEIDRTLVPADRADVDRAVARIVGVFRKADLENAQIYMASLLEDLAGYPADVLERTVVEVRRTCKFFPTIAEVVTIAERLVAVSRRRRSIVADQLFWHRSREAGP